MNVKEELRKYIKFIIGGGLGLLANVIVTFMLTEFMGVPFRASYILGLAANIIFNFIFHMVVTFKTKEKASIRFVKFVPLTLSIAAANYLFVRIFTELIIISLIAGILGGYYKYVVIVLVTAAISVINYALNRYLVFK